MNSIKKALDKIFIEGLSAMAQGLFATLIIGTIIQQIGNLIPGQLGTLVFMAGKVAASLTGAGIGAALAFRFKESTLVVVSAATAGMMGAFAGNVLAGKVLVDGAMVCRTGGTVGSVSCSLCGNLFWAYSGRENKD